MKPAILVLLAATALAGGARAEALRDLCPDRPAKGTAPCTVDRGHLQLEVDALDVTRDHANGVTTTTTVVASPALKYGVSDRLDLEASWAPYTRVSVKDPADGRSHLSGVGDLYLRAKLSLAGQGGDGVSLAVVPYVKAPTARHGLGDGAWEEGLLVPVAANLPHGWSLGLTPELDRLRNGDDDGWHGAASASLGLTHALVRSVSFTGEVWGQENWDPIGTERQVSADAALAWQPSGHPDLQLDAGVNLGLNRQTPDVQAYVGLARRF